MKIKPKDISVSLPAYFLFDNQNEIALFARDVNRIMHGYTKVKYEELGMFSGQYVGIFYLSRDKEYMEYRSFVKNNVLDPEYHDIPEKI